MWMENLFARVRHCKRRSIRGHSTFGFLPYSYCLQNVYTTHDPSRDIDRGLMYARVFRKAGETRRFTISDAGDSGWEVREEQDSRVISRRRYTDWHRVERARMSFATQA